MSRSISDPKVAAKSPLLSWQSAPRCPNLASGGDQVDWSRLDFVPFTGITCACRKLNPGISVMESVQDWATKNVPGAIDGARDLCLPQIKPEHIGDAVHPGSDGTECVPLPRRHVISARLCSTISECACHCTTRLRNAHGIAEYELLYPPTCTLVLSAIPRSRICVTSRASLGFHAARVFDLFGREFSNSGVICLVRRIQATPGIQWLICMLL